MAGVTVKVAGNVGTFVAGGVPPGWGVSVIVTLGCKATASTSAVTLAEPTQPMIAAASEAGFYRAANGTDYARIQILTIHDLLIGLKRPEFMDYKYGEEMFKRAPREDKFDQQDRKLL